MKMVRYTNIKILWLPLLLLIASCGGAADEHGHAHDERAVTFTQLSDSLELFVEFSPLVKGHLTSFAAHLTDLEGYEPLLQGKVTVSLVKDGKGIRNTVDAPRAPGIFTPALEPKEAGIYTLYFDVDAPGRKTRFVLNDIPVFDNDEAAAEYNFVNADAGEVTFLKETAWKNDFAIGVASLRLVPEIIKSSGQILPANTAESVVAATASGIVNLQENTVTGSSVSSGQLLFTISSSGMAGDGNREAQIAAARAAFNEAKANYERGVELVEDRLITQQDLEQRKSAFDQARAALAALTANYSLNGQRISSPTQGFISKVLVSDGQFVNAGEPLARVIKNQKLQLKVKVGQQYYDALAAVDNATIKTPATDQLLYLKELNGSMRSYGRRLEDNVFIPVILELDNHPFLIPGSFAEVWLHTLPAREALAVPAGAIMEEFDNYFVYVMVSGESYSKKQVAIGKSDGKFTEIISGLDAGDIVVTEGSYLIKMASMSGTIPAHGHEH